MDLTFGAKVGPCTVCGEEGRACGRCRVDFYCGKEHQAQDWPRHRKGCGVLALRRSEALGRYLEAAREIPAGTMLMREVPLVVFPKPPTLVTTVACLGCLKVWPSERAAACERCGWPVCDSACSDHRDHQAECSAFQRAHFRYDTAAAAAPDSEKNDWHCDAWYAVAALRVHLAAADGARSRILELQSELPARKAILDDSASFGPWLVDAHDVFEERRGDAVQWLRQTARLTWIAAQDLRFALGAALLNAVPAFSSSDYGAGALFAGLSLLEHSCVANARAVAWQPVDGGEAAEHVLVAARAIARGEHVSLSYRGDPTRGATVRRMELAWRGFLCRCALCDDPTEGQLHLEAWHCARCKRRGLRVLMSALGLGRWRCEGCGCHYAADEDEDADEDGDEGSGHREVMALVGRMAELQQAAPVPAEEWQRLIADALWPAGPLHPTHHLVLQAKQQLVGLDATKTDASWAETSLVADDPEQTAGLCRDLLAVANKVCPGLSVYRRDIMVLLFCALKGRLSRLLDAPRGQPQVGTAIQALKLEIDDLVRDLTLCAVSPFEKKRLEEAVQDYKEICEGTRSSAS